MEAILSETRPARTEKDSSITKLSLQLTDTSKSKNISRANREEIDRSQLKQDTRRRARYHHSKETANEGFWTNDAMNDDSEEEDNDDGIDLEKIKQNESRCNSEVFEKNIENNEERNNNLNIRRGNTDQRRAQSKFILEDDIRLKKQAHKKEEMQDTDNCEIDTTDSPPTPLPSPSVPNQGSSVVDAVAGTSASVAVNSFLKFSIQNILQVIVYKCLEFCQQNFLLQRDDIFNLNIL